MCTSSPSVDSVAETPEAAETPDVATARISGDADETRRRAAAGTSSRSTILTSSRGTTTSGATQTKTLLGQ